MSQPAGRKANLTDDADFFQRHTARLAGQHDYFAPTAGSSKRKANLTDDADLQRHTARLAEMKDVRMNLPALVGKELCSFAPVINEAGEDFGDMGFALRESVGDAELECLYENQRHAVYPAYNTEIQQLISQQIVISETIQKNYALMCVTAITDYCKHMKQCSEAFLAKYEPVEPIDGP
jgi:hypothetical protein